MRTERCIDSTDHLARIWSDWAATLAAHDLPFAFAGLSISDLDEGEPKPGTVDVAPACIDLHGMRSQIERLVADADAIAAAYSRHAIKLHASIRRQQAALAADFIAGPKPGYREDDDVADGIANDLITEVPS